MSCISLNPREHMFRKPVSQTLIRLIKPRDEHLKTLFLKPLGSRSNHPRQTTKLLVQNQFLIIKIFYFKQFTLALSQISKRQAEFRRLIGLKCIR